MTVRSRQFGSPRPLPVALLMFIATAGCDFATASTGAMPGIGNILGPWSPIPVAIPAGIMASADRACRGLGMPEAVQIVVIDARGKGIVQVAYAGPNGAMAQCNDMTLDAQGRVAAMGGGSTGQGGGPLPAVAPNTLEPAGGSSSGDPVTSSVTIGRAGPGIAAVAIIIPGQVAITASFTNGWYLAWFPGAWPAGTKVVGFDAQGQKVAETTT